MNTMGKLIEVKYNKKVWKKTKIKIVDSIIIMITLLAIYLLLNSFVAMVEHWCIIEIQLIIGIISLVWLGIFTLYLLIVKGISSLISRKTTCICTCIAGYQTPN